MHPALVLLILVPIMMYGWARRHRPRRVWILTGAAFGVIVAPFALALYTASYLAVFLPEWLRFLGFIPGFPGFALARIHEAPAIFLASLLDLETPASPMTYLFLEGINGLVWGAAYGGLGWMWDRRRSDI